MMIVWKKMFFNLHFLLPFLHSYFDCTGIMMTVLVVCFVFCFCFGTTINNHENSKSPFAGDGGIGYQCHVLQHVGVWSQYGRHSYLLPVRVVTVFFKKSLLERRVCMCVCVCVCVCVWKEKERERGVCWGRGRLKLTEWFNFLQFVFVLSFPLSLCLFYFLHFFSLFTGSTYGWPSLPWPLSVTVIMWHKHYAHALLQYVVAVCLRLSFFFFFLFSFFSCFRLDDI